MRMSAYRKRQNGEAKKVALGLRVNDDVSCFTILPEGLLGTAHPTFNVNGRHTEVKLGRIFERTAMQVVTDALTNCGRGVVLLEGWSLKKGRATKICQNGASSRA